jgi:hypothetical protein
MGSGVSRSDTKQAFLNYEIGTEVLYMLPPYWWPEIVPEGHALRLMKSIWYAAGGTAMARAHLNLDGGPGLCRGQQREDYLHEA